LSFERPDIVRPPSEARDYFLPLTGGCSNNTCGFCRWYGQKLTLRELDAVKAEIDALATFVNTGMLLPELRGDAAYIAHQWDGRRIFLQDGDALVYPYPKLLAALEHLNLRLPHLERVAAYATPQDLLRLDVAQLAALKALKLDLIYVGVESGDAVILERVAKHATPAEIVTACRRVTDAGINLSVTLILGLGGVERSREHAAASARILTEIDPEYAGALTLMLVPGTPLYDAERRGEFEMISAFDSLRELRTLVADSELTNCFFSSMHASNYVSLRGWLSRQRAEMLESLDAVLGAQDPRRLRPDYLRGL
jgi:radical SAM superfamily enzyme YgiQ (UPF0313 family)